MTFFSPDTSFSLSQFKTPGYSYNDPPLFDPKEFEGINLDKIDLHQLISECGGLAAPQKDIFRSETEEQIEKLRQSALRSISESRQALLALKEDFAKNGHDSIPRVARVSQKMASNLSQVQQAANLIKRCYAGTLHPEMEETMEVQAPVQKMPKAVPGPVKTVAPVAILTAQPDLNNLKELYYVIEALDKGQIPKGEPCKEMRVETLSATQDTMIIDFDVKFQWDQAPYHCLFVSEPIFYRGLKWRVVLSQYNSDKKPPGLLGTLALDPNNSLPADHIVEAEYQFQFKNLKDAPDQRRFEGHFRNESQELKDYSKAIGRPTIPCRYHNGVMMAMTNILPRDSLIGNTTTLNMSAIISVKQIRSITPALAAPIMPEPQLPLLQPLQTPEVKGTAKVHFDVKNFHHDVVQSYKSDTAVIGDIPFNVRFEILTPKSPRNSLPQIDLVLERIRDQVLTKENSHVTLKVTLGSTNYPHIFNRTFYGLLETIPSPKGENEWIFSDGEGYKYLKIPPLKSPAHKWRGKIISLEQAFLLEKTGTSVDLGIDVELANIKRV